MSIRLHYIAFSHSNNAIFTDDNDERAPVAHRAYSRSFYNHADCLLDEVVHGQHLDLYLRQQDDLTPNASVRH